MRRRRVVGVCLRCSCARAGEGGGGRHQLGGLEVASLPGAPLLGLLPLIHQESGCGFNVATTEAESAASLHPGPTPAASGHAAAQAQQGSPIAPAAARGGHTMEKHTRGL